MPHDLQLTSEPAQEEVVMLRRKLRKNVLYPLSKLVAATRKVKQQWMSAAAKVSGG